MTIFLIMMMPEQMIDFTNPQYAGRCRYYYQQIYGPGHVEMPVGGVQHGSDIEELVGYLGDEQLSEDDYCHYCPETVAHFEGEDAFAGFKTACVEHVPEVGPNED